MRTPGSGRKPGGLNKSTRSVKAALQEAFERLGGVDSLVKWGKQEPAEFYKLWVKMMPTEVEHTGHAGGPIQIEQKIDFSKIPTQELIEYESVLAKLRSRTGQATSRDRNGDNDTPAN